MLNRYVNKLISLLKNKKTKFEDAIVRILPKAIGIFFKGNSNIKLDEKKTLLPVTYAACRQGFSVSQAVEYLREKGYEVHSAKYILDKLKQVDVNVVKLIFTKCREVIFQTLLKLGFKERKCLIAIDYHDKPFYGDKRTKETVGCKRKAGTNYAYRYITACIVEEGIRFNLECMPVIQLDDEQELLEKVINSCKKYSKIGCLLLDRGFNKIKNYKLLEEELGLEYIMPQQKNSKIQEMLKKKNLKAYSQFEYVFYENRPEEYRYRVKMFYIESEDGEKYTFVTNIKADDKKLLEDIVACYDKRWGVETGYRVKENFLCKTTSKSFTLRTFFTLLSFVLQDLWTFKNYLLHKKMGTHQPRLEKIIKSKTTSKFLKAASEKLDFYWRPISKALIFCELCCDVILSRLNKIRNSC